MMSSATMKGLKGVSSVLNKGHQAVASSSSSSSLIVTKQNIAENAATAGFHRTATRDYPLAAPLPLPANIDQSESTRFSPQRHRDLNATMLAAHRTAPAASTFGTHRIDITVDQTVAAADAHIGRYDCTGAVSLRSSMQSNVPSPFGGMHKFTHLNMPGGQYGQGIRLMACDQQQSHYTQLRRDARQNWAAYDQTAKAPAAAQASGIVRALLKRHDDVCSATTSAAGGSLSSLLTQNGCVSACFTRSLHDDGRRQKSGGGGVVDDDDGLKKPAATAQEATPTPPVVVSRAEMLKKAVKEYGSTVIVFHVGISLLSLGTSYALISSGLDVVAILRSLGWGESALSARLETGGAVASTFVIAYAVHKCFAPVRISITLGATPFIVRYLRRRGILKATAAPPPPPSPKP